MQVLAGSASEGPQKESWHQSPVGLGFCICCQGVCGSGNPSAFVLLLKHIGYY
jgi:hypothetical protein